MKTILVLSILFSVIALPALGELTEADLNQIRLIVQEVVKAEIAITNTKIEGLDARLRNVETNIEGLDTRLRNVETKIDGLDARMRNVETNIAEMRGRSIAVSGIKDWGVALCALGALIVSIIALRKKQSTVPQAAQDTPKAVSQ